MKEKLKKILRENNIHEEYIDEICDKIISLFFKENNQQQLDETDMNDAEIERMFKYAVPLD